MQQYYRSAKPGQGDPRPLSAREWIASLGGYFRQVNREDFAGEDLVSAQCSDLRFTRCQFPQADLRQATLRKSYFNYCDFTDANLTGADLRDASFWHCIFGGARLDGALTTGAQFERCEGLPADLGT